MIQQHLFVFSISLFFSCVDLLLSACNEQVPTFSYISLLTDATMFVYHHMQWVHGVNFVLMQQNTFFKRFLRGGKGSKICKRMIVLWIFPPSVGWNLKKGLVYLYWDENHGKYFEVGMQRNKKTINQNGSLENVPMNRNTLSPPTSKSHHPGIAFFVSFAYLMIGGWLVINYL